MKTNFLRISAAALVFTISYIGVSSSTQSRNIAGKNVKVTEVTLGTSARAYCNEAPDNHNNGLCTGFFEDPSTRCLTPANPTGKQECKL